MHYQWSKEGISLNGETNSVLALPNVQLNGLSSIRDRDAQAAKLITINAHDAVYDAHESSYGEHCDLLSVA